MVSTPAGAVPEVHLSGVTKRFRNAALALENISLTIERGEFVTFLGPSGCGVAKMLDLVGLSHVGERYPRQLSGGMKMRVSIARALVSRPRILLLDEPFAALDEMTRDRLNEELLRLYAEQKWTVLFVTHSVAEAVFLSSRIIILAPHPGRVAHDVRVDLPWPRTAEMRESSAFENMVTQASRLLRGVYKS